MEKNTKKAYTLAELEEMNQAFNKRIATARAEIEQNKREIDAINEKMDKATDSGDVERYKKLYAQRTSIELNITAVSAIVEKSEKNHATGFDDRDVIEAWNTWIEQHNATTKEKIDRFNSMIDECRKLYREIRKRYDNAENTRDKYASFASLDSRANKKIHEVPIGFKPIIDNPNPNYYFYD